MMKLDSQYWFNSENIDQKMDQAVLIPDVVYDKTDYYTRLQEQALLLETYDFNQIDKMMDNDGLIQWKNQKLIPLFNSVKGIIKHMKVDRQFIYYQELKALQIRLEEKHGQKGESFLSEKKKALEEGYERLIRKYHQEMGRKEN